MKNDLIALFSMVYDFINFTNSHFRFGVMGTQIGGMRLIYTDFLFPFE